MTDNTEMDRIFAQYDVKQFQVDTRLPLLIITDDRMTIVEEAKASINQLLLKARRDELQHVLTNSSGGGSWRRVINSRIAELEKGITYERKET